MEGQFVLELKWLLLGEWLGDGSRMYRETYDYTGPLAAMAYKYLDLLFGKSSVAHHVVSSAVIIVQAGIFNGILLRNKAFDENNYLPAFFYVVLMMCVPDFMALSPQLTCAPSANGCLTRPTPMTAARLTNSAGLSSMAMMRTVKKPASIWCKMMVPPPSSLAAMR